MSDSALLQNCRLCPRECGVNRYQELGFCGAGAELKINLAQLHFGEEPPISGSCGSGTIFFAHCNLLCVFCQNHLISLEGHGTMFSEEECAVLMLQLQQKGAHNINLVTPTHFSAQIASSLKKAKAKALQIPIVWNSSAYEKTSVLLELEGLVDIYLPDFKYFHKFYARKYSQAADYPQVAMNAIREMYRQCGNLQTDEYGIAQRGTLIRLLVLPRGLAGTKHTLYQLADEFGTEISLSLMAQYYPAGNAFQYPELDRGIYAHEYQEVVDTAMELGFSQVFVQQLSGNDHWTPKFHTETDAATKSVQYGVTI